MVNSWILLANDTESSNLNVAGVLDTSLKMYFIIGTYQGFPTQVKNRYFLEYLYTVPPHLSNTKFIYVCVIWSSSLFSNLDFTNFLVRTWSLPNTFCHCKIRAVTWLLIASFLKYMRCLPLSILYASNASWHSERSCSGGCSYNAR